MEPLTLLLSLGSGVAAACAAAEALCRLLSDPSATPLLGILQRQGVGVEALQQQLGAEAFGRAVRLCMLCDGRELCRLRLPRDSAPDLPTGCPNAAYLEKALRHGR